MQVRGLQSKPSCSHYNLWFIKILSKTPSEYQKNFYWWKPNPAWRPYPTICCSTVFSGWAYYFFLIFYMKLVNYAHLHWGSVSLVDICATYWPSIYCMYLAIGHTTSGGRWKQPSSSIAWSQPWYYLVLIYQPPNERRLSWPSSARR